ncbi:hypothetical protein NDI56_16065 [Haloarcula sp. S1CR25-12]|uniref:Uncharacterized protein n=1 Tax=Haloarcula saliterrae TaxID=2950534 RepID=A0ABU2FFA2_9EURY|nr:hypothetical protein [Haloarcula sp. S1CR25-12]MDS0260917.1 hypothetical protein [Haloarcula sp. S1CR25-12]
MSLVKALRTELSFQLPVIFCLGLLAVTAIGNELLRIAFSGFATGSADLPVWLPQLGSVGQTAVLYITVMEFLKYIAIPASLIWLAYSYGRYVSGNSGN